MNLDPGPKWSQDIAESAQECIRRIQAGDAQATEDLLRLSSDHMQRLTRKMLGGFPGVKRFEQTEDIQQNAAIRLCTALKSVELQDAEHYFRLMALQIRRELLDLARSLYGPQGLGANYKTQAPQHDASQSGAQYGHDLAEASRSDDPQQLMKWVEFHETIGRLPEEHQQLFDLFWYNSLSQEEAATVLGTSVRTVRRRWRDAKLALFEQVKKSGLGIESQLE